jgi:hypothetical protein
MSIRIYNKVCVNRTASGMILEVPYSQVWIKSHSRAKVPSLLHAPKIQRGWQNASPLMRFFHTVQRPCQRIPDPRFHRLECDFIICWLLARIAEAKNERPVIW